jgi:hypothetical protein
VSLAESDGEVEEFEEIFDTKFFIVAGSQAASIAVHDARL